MKGFLKKHQFIKYWDPVVIYGLFLLSMAFWPTTPSPESVIGWNISANIKHIIAYFGFSFLLGWAARHSKFSILNKRHYLFAVVIGISVGIIDEMIQGFVPGRHSQVSDVMMDFIGVIGAQGFRWILKKEKKLNKIF